MRGRAGGSRRDLRRGGERGGGEGVGERTGDARGEGLRAAGRGEEGLHSRRAGDIASLLIFRRRLYLRGPFC